MSGGMMGGGLSSHELRRLRRDTVKACRKVLRKTGFYEEKRKEYQAQSLMEFIFEASPHLDRSYHLKVYCDTIELAPGQSLELVFHAPPQHGKSVSTLHAFLWWDLLAGRGTLEAKVHAYITYNSTIAREKALEFRQLAERCGFEPTGTLDRIALKNGTIVRFGSIGGTLTGLPITGVCIVDDPHKDMADARSVAKRRKTISWWKGTAQTRQHPGTSYIVMATRWVKNDLSGHLISEGWHYICLKAVAEGVLGEDGRVVDDPNHRRPGEALWPSERPTSFLDKHKSDIYFWSAMYQGEPIPEGHRMFHEPGDTVLEPVLDKEGMPVYGPDGQEMREERPVGPRYFSEKPTGGYKVAFGLDVAGTASKRADWTVLVEGRRVGNDLYIWHVERAQMLTTEFGHVIKRRQDRAPRGTRIRWYAAGPEKSVASHWRKPPYNVQHLKVLPATQGKKSRALSFSLGWNSGHVLLPDDKVFRVPWLEDFLQVVCDFTGEDGAVDDDVDAAAACWDELFPRGLKDVGSSNVAAPDLTSHGRGL